jgi:hypothetical protein
VVTFQAVAEFLLEGNEAERFPDSPQGDKKRILIGGGVEETVQAGAQKVQALQEGGELGLVLPAALLVQLSGEMPRMAAEGRGAETMLMGQAAAGQAPNKLAIDLLALGVIADGAPFIHEGGLSVFGFRLRLWEKVIGKGKKGPERAGEMTEKKAKGVGIRKEFDRGPVIIYHECEEECRVENTLMITEEAKAEVFWLAFKGLPKKEQHLIVEKLLQDREFVEDLLDIALIEQRRSEPSRPLEEYLAEKGK